MTEEVHSDERSIGSLVWHETMMLSSLPPEIFNLIVDNLRDEPDTLKACCVVSNSWVSRTRRHLFARIEFHPNQSSLQSWMRAFSDPSNSPAHHTRSLSIHDPSILSAASTNVRAWIRAFNRVFHLDLGASQWVVRRSSLAFLHGLSPTLRSLSITLGTRGQIPSRYIEKTWCSQTQSNHNVPTN